MSEDEYWEYSELRGNHRRVRMPISYAYDYHPIHKNYDAEDSYGSDCEIIDLSYRRTYVPLF